MLVFQRLKHYFVYETMPDHYSCPLCSPLFFIDAFLLVWGRWWWQKCNYSGRHSRNALANRLASPWWSGWDILEQINSKRDRLCLGPLGMPFTRHHSWAVTLRFYREQSLEAAVLRKHWSEAQSMEAEGGVGTWQCWCCCVEKSLVSDLADEQCLCTCLSSAFLSLLTSSHGTALCEEYTTALPTQYYFPPAKEKKTNKSGLCEQTS